MKIEYISSDGIHRAEKLAIEKMREAFNASQFSQRWHGFAGFEMIDRETRDREIDLVLLTEDRLLLIELKDWHGAVTAAGDQWYLNGDYRGRSPVKVTSAKARILHSRIKRRLTGGARNTSVEYFVVFSGKTTFSNIPADEQQLVLSLDAFLRLSSQSVYSKYFRPVSSLYSPCQDVNTFRLLFSGNDFRPTVFSFHNYRVTGDPIFAHPQGLYKEFKAVKKDDANYQALLRRWDFSSMTGQADTIEERARVALREHQVIGFVREQNEALEAVLPAPLWSPTQDDVQVDFCELYRLPGKQSRLSEFVNKYGPQLTPSDRVVLVKVLLSHFASLHDIKVAHRDIGDHSVWLELPTKVSLSGFVTAYLPEAMTVGELRRTLRASNVSIPEDVQGLGADVKSDPFRRDVYMLGVVCHYLLFLKWPTRDSQLQIYLWDDATLVDSPFTKDLSLWLARSLELVPNDRFANAREMLNGLNSTHCQAGDAQAVSMADFAPYETETLPLDLYPVESTKKSGRTHLYLSSVGADKVLVKLWYGLQPDARAPEKSHGLLAFLEKCKHLKEQRPEGVPFIHDFGISPAGTFVVQSFIEGITLAETLKAPIALDQALRISQTLIDSIQRLHRLGHEHGDISPQNIVLVKDGAATFIDLVDPAVQGTRFTPAYVPPNHESVPLDQIDCYAVALICKELIDAAAPAGAADVAAIHREIDACINGAFEVFLLDRIADEIAKSLQPKAAPTLESIVIVRLRRQGGLETLTPDNGALHVGVFEDPRRDDVIVLTVFGIRSEVSISLNPETRVIVNLRSSHFGHSDFVWRLKKAKAHLNGTTVEVRPGAADSANELLDLLLATEDVVSAISGIGSRRESRTAEPALHAELWRSPPTRELWKALIRAEEETLPEVEISGPIERDHLSGAVKIPYTTTGEPLDFDPEDAIEVLEEVDDDLRKIGELNTRETTLTALVVEKPFRVPNRLGVVLKLRSQQDRASFMRRRSAVDRVVNEESVIPNLLEYFDPAIAPAPIAYGDSPTEAEFDAYTLTDGEKQVFSLNPQQREAFRKVWTTGPVGLLQGPPGTGKTAFIASFVHYAISKGAQNILLASQSHEAVNNAAEKIVDLCRRTELPLHLVRFGAEGMVSDPLRRYHSSAVIQAYRDLAVAELRTRVVSLSANLGLPTDFVSTIVDLDHHLGDFVRLIDRLERRMKTLPEESAEARRHAHRIRQAREMCATIAFEKFGVDQSEGPKSDLEALERRALQEYGVRSPDLVSRLRSVIAVAREWVHRLGSDRANFEEFLAKTRTLVCGTCVGLGRSQFGISKNEYDWVVVDEAARATPSELAVAIQSGRRVLLVGDHRQLPPVYKEEVVDYLAGTSRLGSREYLTRSDFQRCFESEYGKQVGTMLRVQYRMVPEIGELVSECFYPERLEPGRSGSPPWFASAPDEISSTVTWVDTSDQGKDARERQQRGSTSYENPLEARTILQILKSIVRNEKFLTALSNDSAGDERPIGVICMYADQRRLLQKLFDEQDWSSQLRRLLKIDTVDSYQGKQNRIIIVSTTRNNREESQGHVGIAERVNVSISRAMDRLVIVGAARMWRGKNHASPMGRVLHFIEHRESAPHYRLVSAPRGRQE